MQKLVFLAAGLLLLFNFTLGYEVVLEPPTPNMLSLHTQVFLNVLDATKGVFRQRVGCIEGYVFWHNPQRQPEYYVVLCDEQTATPTWFILNEASLT